MLDKENERGTQYPPPPLANFSISFKLYNNYLQVSLWNSWLSKIFLFSEKNNAHNFMVFWDVLSSFQIFHRLEMELGDLFKITWTSGPLYYLVVSGDVQWLTSFYWDGHSFFLEFFVNNEQQTYWTNDFTKQIILLNDRSVKNEQNRWEMNDNIKKKSERNGSFTNDERTK